MKITVHKLAPTQWADLSENAHKICFGTVKPKEWDRIDFTLVAIDEDKKQMIGYITLRELDHETIYWQHGGSFPEYRGTLFASKAYSAFISWCKEAGYKRVTTLIENTNRSMLRLAAHNGLLVVGVRNFKGKVLLEHGIEF